MSDQDPEHVSSTDQQDTVLLDLLLEYILSVESFEEAELRHQFGQNVDPVKFNLDLWKAKEEAREVANVVYRPDGHGRFVRATDEQKLKRGKKFAKTAFRKLDRGVNVLDSVTDPNLPGLSSTRERLGRAAIRARQEAGIHKSPVTICEVPKTPRRNTR